MSKGSATTTILAGSAGLLLLAAVAWFGLLSPALGAVSETETARTDAQDQHATMAVQLAGLRKQVDDLPRLARTGRRLETVFPATADQPGFFAQVNEAAEQAGISADGVRSIALDSPVVLGAEPDTAPPAQAEPPTSQGSPSERANGAAAAAGQASQTRSTLPPDAAASAGSTIDADAGAADDSADVPITAIAVQTVTVEVAGDYDQLVQLVDGLESMDRALLVQTVSVATEEATTSSVTGETGTEGGTIFVMTLSGSTFVAPPLGGSPRAPGVG